MIWEWIITLIAFVKLIWHVKAFPQHLHWCLVGWTFICLWKNHLYDHHHIYIPELNLYWPTPCRPTPPPWSSPCQPPGWPPHEPHRQNIVLKVCLHVVLSINYLNTLFTWPWAFLLCGVTLLTLLSAVEKLMCLQDWGFDEIFVTISSMSALGRLSLSVGFHAHLQVVSTRKHFSTYFTFRKPFSRN